MRRLLAIPVGVVSLLSFRLPAADLVVPVVLDVRSGAAHYLTELTLTNGGASPAVLGFTYRGSLGSAFGSASDELAAGTQRTIPDVIGWLEARGVSFPGLASGAPQAGTLRITLPDELAASIAAVARTTTPTAAPHPAGAAGLAYLAAGPTSAFSGRAVVHGLRATETERSNLAVWNPGSSPVTLRIVAASGTGDGREVPVAESWSLGPGEWRQVDGILARAGIPQGWAIVERVSGGSFSAYGVVNDDGTNDGSFLEAAPDAAAPGAIVVPVLVETPGFRTELILANRGPAAAPLDLDYRESLSPSAGPGGHATVTLAPREQRIVADAFAFLRSIGIAAGPAGTAPLAGRLRVTGPEDATGLWAAARVVSPSPGGGAYGVFLPGARSAPASGTEAWIAGLRSDTEVRSNVALVHAGPAGSGAVELELRAFNALGGGVLAGAPARFTLAEGEWRQLADPLRPLGVTSGWVRVTRIAGTAPWLAYGVLNDGAGPGLRTGDGAYVPAVPSASAPSGRIAPADLSYLGAFRLPAGGERPFTFEYGGNAMTFRPGGDPAGGADGFPGSLFVSGHDRMPYGELPDGSRVAEVAIPAPVVSRDPEALPVARLLQPLTDVTGSLFAGIDEIPRLGMQYLDRPETGPRIHLAWGEHLPLPPFRPTHAWFEPDLSAPRTRGAWFLEGLSPWEGNGYMLEIPDAWASAHAGGRVLGTGRYRDGGMAGMGPALFAYRPWLDSAGTPPAPGATLPATRLLRYASTLETEKVERGLVGTQHCDTWERAAWLTTASGKSAVLFAGTKGVGARFWYGFLNPAGPDLPCVAGDFVNEYTTCRLADGTPCAASEMVECAGHTSSRGWWSSRFAGWLLLYDPDDLARVASGESEPWEPQPYAHLDVDPFLFLNPSGVDLADVGPGVQQRFRLGDVTFDRASGLLYLLELFADGARPVVHVFRVR
ncbi:MAG: hypothetical protein KBB14_16765 [Thermoanaerobaculia bacterium]|nr:hypothetical protein [Thermoanaerobaculia bacterium]